MNNNDRKLIAPESSKSNTIHPNRGNILNSREKVEKSIDTLYNFFRGESNKTRKEIASIADKCI